MPRHYTGLYTALLAVQRCNSSRARNNRQDCNGPTRSRRLFVSLLAVGSPAVPARQTCPAAPPTTNDDALSDAMHARALPAHAPALNGCASRATHSPPFVTISAVRDAPRSVRNGSVRIRNRIGNTIHTHHQHDAPIARSRHSRARPAAVCERGRVPFQSPEIVETSSPCSPQKETNRRC